MAWTSKRFSIGHYSVINLTECGGISEAPGLNTENCITFSLQQWHFALLSQQKWQKAKVLLMKTAFFLQWFQEWAWRWHKRPFLKRLFPDTKIFKVEPTCTGELNPYPRPVSLEETLPPPHHVPTVWADEQPLVPQLLRSRLFLTPERGDVLSLPSWFMFHLFSLILGFCGVERDSESPELWDEMPQERCINSSKANSQPFDFSWVSPMFILSLPVTTAGIQDLNQWGQSLTGSNNTPFPFQVSQWWCAHVPSGFPVPLDTAVRPPLLSLWDLNECSHISNPAHTKTCTWGTQAEFSPNLHVLSL